MDDQYTSAPERLPSVTKLAGSTKALAALLLVVVVVVVSRLAS